MERSKRIATEIGNAVIWLVQNARSLTRGNIIDVLERERRITVDVIRADILRESIVFIREGVKTTGGFSGLN
ncbi:hypothetical protein YL93_17595 [Salmonella enterica subsp. enterica serovar Montevideo]|nr:hypothetical protein [Salmonella enterica subsp. enterica serovar Montevideo]HCM1918351.1 hypothetical protein [Salmonella enterica subsp. salamae serovar 28:r:e,n,z15]